MSKLADDRAQEMLAELREHFGEPVMPVSRYCAKIDAWIEACRVAKEEYDALDEKAQSWRSKPPLYEIMDALGPVRMLDVGKSNALWRLLYQDEDLRVEKCPIHKGHWSGIVISPCKEGCGSELIGWLPARHEFEAVDEFPGPGDRWQWGFAHPERRCKHCGGLKGAKVHRVRKVDRERAATA